MTAHAVSAALLITRTPDQDTGLTFVSPAANKLPAISIGTPELDDQAISSLGFSGRPTALIVSSSNFNDGS